ncbi:Furostanol glycoside 26-O-beta-glucosidase [Bienertia sinuspersici]
MAIIQSSMYENGTIESGINQEGIDFYNNLIDELIENGSLLSPCILLYNLSIIRNYSSSYFVALRSTTDSAG